VLQLHFSVKNVQLYLSTRNVQLDRVALFFELQLHFSEVTETWKKLSWLRHRYTLMFVHFSYLYNSGLHYYLIIADDFLPLIQRLVKFPCVATGSMRQHFWTSITIKRKYANWVAWLRRECINKYLTLETMAGFPLLCMSFDIATIFNSNIARFKSPKWGFSSSFLFQT
jgi:hypothetical protein